MVWLIGLESRNEILSENEPASEIGLDHRHRVRQHRQELMLPRPMIGQFQLSICGLHSKVSISASKTSKSSLEIEVLATTGLVKRITLSKQEKPLIFLGRSRGKPRLTRRSLSSTIAFEVL